MLKRFLPLLCLPVVLTLVGCSATLTNLTPTTQVRSQDNQYKVEVAMHTQQQSLRWDSIKPQIIVGNDVFPMRPTLMMTNRWEGFIPVPPTATMVRYHYKFDFKYNAFGPSQPDSLYSPDYMLKIVERKD